MAKTNAAALTAALNTILGHDVGSPDPIQVLQEAHDSATYSRWYVSGNPSTVSDTNDILSDRAMWVRTTVANSAADQAAEIITAMTAANATVNGNVDPNVGP